MIFKAIGVGAVAAGLSAVAALAQNGAPPDRMIIPGISLGGLLGIIATWVGITIGYFQLQRNIKLDRRQAAKDSEDRAREIANQVATSLMIDHEKRVTDVWRENKDDLDRRFSSVMSRETQKAINEGFDARITDAIKVCGTIESLAREIRDLNRRKSES